MQKDPPEKIETALSGVYILKPKRYEDARGYFTELYNAESLAVLGIAPVFAQDSLSYSKKNVLRGLHFQTGEHAQDKLVRCASGVIYDVAADVDPASPTYGTYVGVMLSSATQDMLFIPGRYAHGFCVISDEAYVDYKLSGTHDPAHAGGVAYNDPVLNIAWPIETPILSDKDQAWSPLPRI